MRLFCGGDEKTESTASHVSSTGALYVACVGLQRGCVPQRAIRSANNSRHSRHYKWSLRLANIAPSAVDCNTVACILMGGLVIYSRHAGSCALHSYRCKAFVRSAYGAGYDGFHRPQGWKVGKNAYLMFITLSSELFSQIERVQETTRKCLQIFS